MPGLTIERPKMTRTMYQALKKHIMKEREKKKQEQQEDAMMERRRKERELRKKKEEENSLTLEQTKEQIQSLEEKLESLKQEKHELFSQLKKVLNQEEEARKRAQMKEQNELLSLQQSAPYVIPGPPHMLQMSGRPTLYKPAQPMIAQHSLKRTRSPSPTASSMYQPYEKYSSTYTTSSAKAQHGGIHPHYTGDYKSTNYPQGESVTYGTPDSTSYPQQGTIHLSSQSQSSKYTPSGQSAFQHYPNYASQQKHPISDPYTTQQKHAISDPYAPGYHMQRVSQAGYMPGHGGAISLQQQLDHANQKSGFSEEKYKAHHVRGVMPTMTAQQPTMIAQQLSIHQQQQQQQQQAKGTIGGYPPRTQAPPTSSFQPSPSQGSYQAQSSTSSRPHAYSGQQPGRYY